MKFKLNNEQLNILSSNAKLYSYLSQQFGEAYFKVEPGFLTFHYRGQTGVLNTKIPLAEYDGEESKYFKTDYAKWQTALNRLDNENGISFEAMGTYLRCFIEGTDDEICLSANYFDEEDEVAIVVDTLLNEKRSEIEASGKMLTVTPDFLSNVNLAISLFNANSGAANAVGFNSNEVVYADRLTVFRVSADEAIEESFFENLEEEESYVKLHQYIIGLMNLVFTDSAQIWFNDTYDTIYWKGENTELVINSGSIDMVIPSEEEIDFIKPVEETSGAMTVNIATLKKGVDFFQGFFEGSVWKPIVFQCKRNEEVTLEYKNPSANIKKILNNSEATEEGRFLIEAETLKKLIDKVSARGGVDGVVQIYFDDEAAGVYLTALDKYRVIFAKLLEDM